MKQAQRASQEKLTSRRHSSDRGQGLNHAIADAGKLTELLTSQAGRGLAELIDEYEAEMCARGGEEVRVSETNTRMLYDWTQLMASPLVARGMKPNE